MGRQILFRMSDTDEARFSELLKEKCNAKFIPCRTDKKAVEIYDDLTQINSSECYILNEELSFTPEFTPLNDGKYLLTAKGMSLIEYSAFRRIYSDRNTSRIYLNTDRSDEYDTAELDRLYKKCAGIIRKNAVYIEKAGGNIYYWDGFIKARNTKRPYWIKKDGHLCFNGGTVCDNYCTGCIRDECVPLRDTEENIKQITEEFIENHTGETVIFGAYSEPMSPDTVRIIEKIIYELGSFAPKIIMITNGLAYADDLIKIRPPINDVYVPCPGADIEDYVINTNSKYGMGAKKIIDNFVDNCIKAGLNVHIGNHYRGEVLNGIISGTVL